MIMKLFAVRDSAVEAFLQPFFSPSAAAAVRSLSDAINDEKHPFHAHSADYALWELGEFDDASGILSPLVPISRVVSCENLKSNG